MAKQQFAMVIDSSKCIDCKGCVISCKVANKVPEGFSRNWIKASVPAFSMGPRTRTHFQPGACMHCDTPTCVQACPTGATYKDAETGIVEIDNSLCIGCGNCIPACPYGARFRNTAIRKADKCDYCPERRAAGLLPACVDTCPTKARVFGDINNPDSEVSRMLSRNKGKVIKIVNAQTDTKPNMYYIGETAPTDWTTAAVVPASMTVMKEVSPLIKGIVGLSGLGVLAMLGRQFLASSSDSHEPEHHDEEARHD